MGRYPHCKRWIAEDAPKWPAVLVKTVRGSSPIFYFLNEKGDTVKKIDIQEKDTKEDIEKYLSDNGITIDTPEHDVVSSEIKPTDNCFAFRRTNIDGVRLPNDDEACGLVIPPGGGVGYCDCKMGGQIQIKAISGRTHFTCNDICKDGKVPWDSEEEL